MSKISYTQAELTDLKSQIANHQAALGSLLDSIKGAESLLAARTALSEEPKRDNIQTQYQALKAAVDTVNGMSLSVKSETDFLAGYDAE